MRFAVLITALFAAAAPAAAQTAVPAPEAVAEQARTLSGTAIQSERRAQPEWYKRYAAAGNEGQRPLWQAQPADEDIKISLAPSRRWALQFGLRTRPEESPYPKEELSAGAEFQLSPRFSIGADLSLGTEDIDDTARWDEERVEAGVRLQSAFRF